MSTGFYELENERLLRENAELKADKARLNGWLNLATESKLAVWAHCERLRDVLSESICSNEPCAELFCNAARSVLAETPAESLEAIRAEERKKTLDLVCELNSWIDRKAMFEAIRARGAK